MNKDNIILIGMPGCGKSTVGVVLAKALGYNFTDTDLLIQEREGRLLHEIISAEGAERFIEIENNVIAAAKTSMSVIATGGSAVYGENAMSNLRSLGTIVWLWLPYEEILERVGDIGRVSKRGVVMKNGQSLSDIYNERNPLYKRYADIIVDASRLSLRETVAEIIKVLNFDK